MRAAKVGGEGMPCHYPVTLDLSKAGRVIRKNFFGNFVRSLVAANATFFTITASRNRMLPVKFIIHEFWDVFSEYMNPIAIAAFCTIGSLCDIQNTQVIGQKRDPLEQWL